MVGLGDLPGGSFYSHAYGVSGDGSVVVGYGYTRLGLPRRSAGRPAAGWSGCGTCCSPTASTPPPTGGRSSRQPRASAPTATRSSAHGIRNGNTEAFVASVPVPEPATWLLLAAACVMAVCSSRSVVMAVFSRKA